jgi:hypothetical protein
MSAVQFYPASRSSEPLRERLAEMREDMLARMLQRGSPELGQLPILAGIAAALKALDSREAPAPSTLDAETCIALANELVRAAAALVCAARDHTDRSVNRPRRLSGASAPPGIGPCRNRFPLIRRPRERPGTPL